MLSKITGRRPITLVWANTPECLDLHALPSYIILQCTEMSVRNFIRGKGEKQRKKQRKNERKREGEKGSDKMHL
jgi:hypothetical protein